MATDATFDACTTCGADLTNALRWRTTVRGGTRTLRIAGRSERYVYCHDCGAAKLAALKQADRVKIAAHIEGQ